MENYTRIIGATSTNIRTPTDAEIGQGNNQLTPFESAKMNGYYNEMSKQIGALTTEIRNYLTDRGFPPSTDLTQFLQAIDADFANPNFGNLTVNNKLTTPPIVKTISSGSISYTGSYLRLNGEGNINDTLNVITGGSLGDRLLLKNNGANGIITVLDNDVSGGNILLVRNQNTTLEFSIDSLELVYDGTNWIQINSESDADFASVQAASGSTNLPNGLIIKFGNFTPSASQVVFSAAFPNNIFQVINGLTNSSFGAVFAPNQISTKDWTTTGFYSQITSNDIGGVRTYIAIGN